MRHRIDKAGSPEALAGSAQIDMTPAVTLYHHEA